MHKTVISKRYGKLYEVLIIKSTMSGEDIVFPVNDLPLVFRTDASARRIGGLMRDFYNATSREKVWTLTVDGVSLVKLPRGLLEEIIKVWDVQAIKLGEVLISENENSLKQSGEDLLKAIYEQAIGR